MADPSNVRPGYPVTGPVLDPYLACIESGELEADAAQRDAIGRLNDLAVRLMEARLASKKSALGWIFGKRAARQPPVRGLYIWGDVGRGKTLLMDLFFQALPIDRKKRVHFHEFMADIHDRIKEARRQIKIGALKDGDPIVPVAAALADETRLLCFDEFSVTDIADAMILARLFRHVFQHGTVVVATSNVPPDELYKHGLNRALFLPFIDLLKQHAEIFRLQARTDFRLEKLQSRPVYFTPADTAADAALDTIWQELTGTEQGAPVSLELRGRQVDVPEAAHGVARFTFDDLCQRPLGSADFLKIAHAFHTVLVDRIPVIDPDQRNAAKRFITLIDTLYDNRVKLVASAAAQPDALYDAPTGHEAFEFKRTASRLMEMRSHDYLAAAHGDPDPVQKAGGA